MPGARLVPRRHPQLRRARPARRRGPGPRRRPRPAPRRRDPRATPRHLGRAAPPGRLPRRRTARPRRHAPATASAATSPTSRRPSSPSSPPPPSARVWTSCAPDFGARSVLDRFQQVEPVVLFTVDGYRYGGKEHDRTRHRRRTAPRTAHPARRRPHPAARHRRPRGRPGLVRPDRRRRRTGLRAGPLRPPAVGALLLRHHRPAQGHRPVPGRHPARAPQADSACTATSAPRTASSGTPPPAG